MRLAFCILFAAFSLPAAQTFDVVVYGGTPGGIAAAVSAAKYGHTVALIEYQRHLGGMSTSGLGKSDVETRAALGGLFREFVARVHKYYVDKYGANSENVRLCHDGYFFEPSVAEKIFNEMVQEQRTISVFLNHRLEEVSRHQNRVTAIHVTDRTSGVTQEFRAKIFIDATYEGDLAAYAGAAYREGREARSDFDELHAGVVYQDYNTHTFLAGTTGEGDNRLQAYTFRLCLTTDPANSRPLTAPPPGYDRARFTGYIDDWKAGRMGPPRKMKAGVGYFPPTFNTVVRALSIAEIPNHKTDVNMNPRPLGFPFAEENQGYADADWSRREQITEKIRNLTLGLLYFLQNDPEIPAEQRAIARRYQLAKDEFTDNENFPFQLYIREARRIIGLYTLTENDVTVGPALGRPRIQPNSIASGEFPIDSFPVRKHEKGHDVALEGYLLMLDNITRPYQIPYGIIVPQAVDGLLVPVAASTTHIAFSTIRLEPTWMALGQAAGVAAHFCIQRNLQPRHLNVTALQRELLRRDHVLTYFKDIDRSDPAFAAIQYFGTKGFFPDYYSHSREPVLRSTAEDWAKLAGIQFKLENRKPSSPQDDYLTRQEISSLAEGMPDSAWTAPGNKATQPSDPVLRGELCRIFYAKMPHTGD